MMVTLPSFLFVVTRLQNRKTPFSRKIDLEGRINSTEGGAKSHSQEIKKLPTCV